MNQAAARSARAAQTESSPSNAGQSTGVTVGLPDDETSLSDADALSVASRCFGHINQAEWEELTDPGTWSAFLGALERMGAGSRTACMAVLAQPPDWEGYRQAARHFVGGLPDAAVPVESLYATPDQMILRDPDGRRAFWLQQPALYMRDLIQRLGMDVPPEFRDCPDHLALELDLASLLASSDATEQTADFVANRLQWLDRYRAKMASLAPAGESAPRDLVFHAALVEALSAAVAPWGRQDAS